VKNPDEKEYLRPSPYPFGSKAAVHVCSMIYADCGAPRSVRMGDRERLRRLIEDVPTAAYTLDVVYNN
jgi:hypothetical protein